MTDQQGLSIFDSGKAADSGGPTPAFPVVRRGGYDKNAVDAFVRDSDAAVRQLRNDTTAAARQAEQLRAQVEQLTAKVNEAENPSYSGLGGRAAELLAIAEQQADEVLGRSRSQAEQMRQQAQSDVAATIAGAAKEADDIRLAQIQRIEQERQRVLGAAEQERSLAAAEAQNIVAGARREADQVRLAAQQESNAMLTGA
jgi:cell division septum initiation protein DivIVA